MQELENLYCYLGRIDWYAYAIGYVCVILSHFPIKPTVKAMYKKIDSELPLHHEWQWFAIGVTERTLYVTALLLRRGEFIAFWVLLKVAVPYLRWTPKDNPENENNKQQMEKAERGRSLFMNSVIGNGLSILYAGLCYGIIEWVDRRNWYAAFLVSACLVGYTLFLRQYVKNWKTTKRQR